MLFDVSRDMDWFDIFKIRKAGPLAPIQELTDRLIIRDPCVLVPNRYREELEEPLGRFRSDVGNDRWNLEWFGFVKDQRALWHWRGSLAKRTKNARKIGAHKKGVMQGNG
jgi:hypothetical protein